MVSVVVVEFSVMRCQPLRRALGVHQLCEPKVERERKTDFRNFGYLRWN